MSDDLFGSDPAFPEVRHETVEVLRAERDRLRAASKNLLDVVEIIFALARKEGVDVETWGSAHEMLKLTAAQMREALKAEELSTTPR